MKSSILDTYKPNNSKPKPTPDAPAPKPETQTIPFKHLIDFIDDVGDRIADNESLTTKDKISEWVAILNWGIPLVPDEYQKAKAIMQEAILYPSEKDFMRAKAK